MEINVGDRRQRLVEGQDRRKAVCALPPDPGQRLKPAHIKQDEKFGSVLFYQVEADTEIERLVRGGFGNGKYFRKVVEVSGAPESPRCRPRPVKTRLGKQCVGGIAYVDDPLVCRKESANQVYELLRLEGLCKNSFKQDISPAARRKTITVRGKADQLERRTVGPGDIAQQFRQRVAVHFGQMIVHQGHSIGVLPQQPQGRKTIRRDISLESRAVQYPPGQILPEGIVIDEKYARCHGHFLLLSNFCVG
jgi:hypothetical protein